MKQTHLFNYHTHGPQRGNRETHDVGNRIVYDELFASEIKDHRRYQRAACT